MKYVFWKVDWKYEVIVYDKESKPMFTEILCFQSDTEITLWENPYIKKESK